MSQDRLKVIQAIAALAWSDGYLDDKEKEKLRRLGKRMDLKKEEMTKMELFFEECPSLEGLSFDELNEKEKQAMYLLAAHYAYMDGLVWSGEQRVLDKIADLLRISPEIRTKIEKQVQEATQR